MEHVAICSLCDWHESWTTREAAEAAGVWHVYDDHWGVWTRRMGSPDRLPVNSMPEDYGRRLESWESQA